MNQKTSRVGIQGSPGGLTDPHTHSRVELKPPQPWLDPIRPALKPGPCRLKQEHSRLQAPKRSFEPARFRPLPTAPGLEQERFRKRAGSFARFQTPAHAPRPGEPWGRIVRRLHRGSPEIEGLEATFAVPAAWKTGWSRSTGWRIGLCRIRTPSGRSVARVAKERAMLDRQMTRLTEELARLDREPWGEREEACGCGGPDRVDGRGRAGTAWGA